MNENSIEEKEISKYPGIWTSSGRRSNEDIH